MTTHAFAAGKERKHNPFAHLTPLQSGYLVDELFVLNTDSIANNASSSATSTYVVESVNLWYTRLGHVNSALK